MDDLSPIYQMKLIQKIENKLQDEFAVDIQNISYYIKKWHQSWDEDNFRSGENFFIQYTDFRNVDLLPTLHSMDGQLLLQIAIDLGIETPDFLPSIPLFKNELKNNYATAKKSFDIASKNVENHPDVAIGMANSALESIIKTILNSLDIQYNKNNTLYKLTEDVVDYFGMYPDKTSAFSEVKKIGSALLNVNQHIEKLRSEKTQFHGKDDNDYIINDSVYAYFIINSITTVGLFLISIFEQVKKSKAVQNDPSFENLEIPF